MPRIGITGHRGLTGHTARLVDKALRTELGAVTGELVGVSSIADGADSLFAHAVLDLGGSLVVVLPSAGYREAFPASYRAEYDELLGRASRVVQLDHAEPGGQAFMDASARMLDEVEWLLAVWDGEPARGFGGTADVVAEARGRGVPVTVVWPEGARR